MRNGAQDRKALKIAYLESENRNLEQMVEDLQTTLSINKNIIKNILDAQKKPNAGGSNDYLLSQLTQENEMLEANLKRTSEQRDQLNARLFIMQ
jgi:predicted RNase H-like nuclease (RuvC/YqgF family)